MLKPPYQRDELERLFGVELLALKDLLSPAIEDFGKCRSPEKRASLRMNHITRYCKRPREMKLAKIAGESSRAATSTRRP